MRAKGRGREEYVGEWENWRRVKVERAFIPYMRFGKLQLTKMGACSIQA